MGTQGGGIAVAGRGIDKPQFAGATERGDLT